MSLADLLRIENKKKNKSTRQKLGMKGINTYGLETYRQGLIVYFLIKPINVAVLSEANIGTKIQNLLNVLKEIAAIDIICLNSRESFEDNKNFLKERIRKEDNEKIREVLEKDLMFLDRIQVQTASAREFMFIVRFLPDEEEAAVQATISRIDRLLQDNAFTARKAAKEDIKRIFSVYYVQNLTQTYYDDFDGQRYFSSADGRPL